MLFWENLSFKFFEKDLFYETSSDYKNNILIIFKYFLLEIRIIMKYKTF